MYSPLRVHSHLRFFTWLRLALGSRMSCASIFEIAITIHLIERNRYRNRVINRRFNNTLIRITTQHQLTLLCIPWKEIAVSQSVMLRVNRALHRIIFGCTLTCSSSNLNSLSVWLMFGVNRPLHRSMISCTITCSNFYLSSLSGLLTFGLYSPLHSDDEIGCTLICRCWISMRIVNWHEFKRK